MCLVHCVCFSPDAWDRWNIMEQMYTFRGDSRVFSSRSPQDKQMFTLDFFRIVHSLYMGRFVKLKCPLATTTQHNKTCTIFISAI